MKNKLVLGIFLFLTLTTSSVFASMVENSRQGSPAISAEAHPEPITREPGTLLGFELHFLNLCVRSGISYTDSYGLAINGDVIQIRIGNWKPLPPPSTIPEAVEGDLDSTPKKGSFYLVDIGQECANGKGTWKIEVETATTQMYVDPESGLERPQKYNYTRDLAGNLTVFLLPETAPDFYYGLCWAKCIEICLP